MTVRRTVRGAGDGCDGPTKNASSHLFQVVQVKRKFVTGHVRGLNNPPFFLRWMAASPLSMLKI